MLAFGPYGVTSDRQACEDVGGHPREQRVTSAREELQMTRIMVSWFLVQRVYSVNLNSRRRQG